jgi:anaerobic selenocysteine-containing dehydrogenase
VSAFANCGRPVAHVPSGYVPNSDFARIERPLEKIIFACVGEPAKLRAFRPQNPRRQQSKAMTDEIGSPYHGPAGGASTIKAIDDVLAEQGLAESGRPALLHMNQHDGFVCPSCAWPEPRRHQSDEHLFCENGSKAFALEATIRRCTTEFFAAHTIAQLTHWGDYELELEGRLTHPMAYDPASEKYTPIAWEEEAFAGIGAALRSLDRASQAEFYTSGRTGDSRRANLKAKGLA